MRGKESNVPVVAGSSRELVLHGERLMKSKFRVTS